MNLTFRYVLLLLFGASFVGWLFCSGQAGYQESPVLTDRIRRGSLTDTVTATGVLEPLRMVQVGAQVTGQLTALHVRLGEKVRTGDRIADIDSLQQQNELRLAKASLAEVQATQRSRQFQLDKAERSQNRQRELYSGQAGSGADLQDAEFAVRIARADLDLSAAQIEKATVEVEKAETNLRYTRITAPMDGRIIALTAKPGQTLNAAQTTPVIAIIARTDVMVVKVQVAEADVGRIRAGQAVQFTTFGDRLTKRTSTLAEVQPAPSSFASGQEAAGGQQPGGASAQTQAVYYSALFEASNADGKLLPTMTAEVTITVGALENVLLAPWGALEGPDAEGFYNVTVRREIGGTETRRVRVGMTNRIDTEIVEGLSEGEEIVLRADAGPTDTDMMLQ